MKFLLCRPDCFEVRYTINPWMKGNIGRTDHALAKKQWNAFYQNLSSFAEVELIDSLSSLPDMIFTANAGLVIGNDIVLSRYACAQRVPEEPAYKQWFKEQGYTVHVVPDDLFFEGAGDALVDSEGRWIWIAYGSRTSLEVHPYLAKILNVKVITLRLIDPRFYHLDTCFLPLPDNYLLYYPDALDIYSNRLVEKLVPKKKRIVLKTADAISFAANAVVVVHTIFMNRCSSSLLRQLQTIGFEVIQSSFSEFIKSGGSARCLALRIDEPLLQRNIPCSSVSSRTIVTEGHLLESSFMNKICDTIINAGGSFRVKKIQLGQKRTEHSKAEIEVTAPCSKRLEKIIQEIIPLGVCLPQKEMNDCHGEQVTKNGAAPDNFYGTTIYPTQIRVQGKWIDVEKQRMDAVIVVSGSSAQCILLRELKKGDQVVTGREGIRLKRPIAEYSDHGLFSFMGSSVSSERRVEVAIEQVAWDIRRIKERSGRLVIVAGPVVIHTGGSSYLSWMVKNNYVSALLGGNAIAVHDIEQSFYGTSLGVDLKNGQPVFGGHRHHLAAINTIRQAGSILKAVKKEILTAGIFYELVKNNIPFSLAGSIRDDGPLPEVKMDLLKAHQEYAQFLKGADMVLMLSTMLHSIGTGNMTPSGVKIVCVDINPSVVTKLTDRGSLEAIGIVTDVGLFLSRLVDNLKSFDDEN